MRERFHNGSPSALTLEQARELEIKRARERKRQAAQLAAQGRGEDTEIAHVARGEMVIPEAFQTPELLAVLHRAAAKNGVPLDRLRVGSRRNSINPKTGLPEFFGPVIIEGGPIGEVESRTRPWNPSGYELPALPISFNGPTLYESVGNQDPIKLTDKEMDDLVINEWKIGSLGGYSPNYGLPKGEEQGWSIHNGQIEYAGKAEKFDVHRDRRTGEETYKLRFSMPAASQARIHSHPNWADKPGPGVGDYGQNKPVYGITERGVWVVRPNQRSYEWLHKLPEDEPTYE